MSAAAIGFVGMYRAACAVLVDASGNFVNDLLNTWVGRIGEWLILAGVMSAYALHLRRRACATCSATTHRTSPALRVRRLRDAAPRAMNRHATLSRRRRVSPMCFRRRARFG
jgi:hypothetical protein